MKNSIKNIEMCNIHIHGVSNDNTTDVGDPFSVNIVRKLSNSSWSSNRVHGRLALDANDLMVASLWCLGQNKIYLKYNPVNPFFLQIDRSSCCLLREISMSRKASLSRSSSSSQVNFNDE